MPLILLTNCVNCVLKLNILLGSHEASELDERPVIAGAIGNYAHYVAFSLMLLVLRSVM